MKWMMTSLNLHCQNIKYEVTNAILKIQKKTSNIIEISTYPLKINSKKIIKTKNKF